MDLIWWYSEWTVERRERISPEDTYLPFVLAAFYAKLFWETALILRVRTRNKTMDIQKRALLQLDVFVRCLYRVKYGI